MFNKISLIILACLFGSFSCIIHDKGPCPTPTVLNSTEQLKFFGKWYEVARVDSDQEKDLKCVTHEIASNASYQTGHPVTQTGLDNENLEYIYIGNLIFWESQTILEYGEFMEGPLDYGLTVVDTDFENYAILIGCVELPDLQSMLPFGFGDPGLKLIRTRIAWILSRTPKMDAQLQERLVTKLEDAGIQKSYLKFNDPANCPSSY